MNLITLAGPNSVIPVCAYCGDWRPHRGSDQWRLGPAPEGPGITHTHGVCKRCYDEQVASIHRIVRPAAAGPTLL